jgi:hypothetical protein
MSQVLCGAFLSQALFFFIYCFSASPIAGGGMLIAPPRKKKKKGETKVSTAETLNLIGAFCVAVKCGYLFI